MGAPTTTTPINLHKFAATKHELASAGGSTTICYLGTHLAEDQDERVWISKTPGGTHELEIENHHYKGTLEELEQILWEWWKEW